MMNQWDGYAERARQQLPAAPQPLLDGYVKWAPWVAMVFGALGAILAVAGLLGLSVATASGVPGGFGALVNVALLLVVCVLEFIGGYQMRLGSLTGWWILAIGLALNLLTSLLSLAVLGFIITLLVAYIHLQVKPRYH
jgi:hypothetical protein